MPKAPAAPPKSRDPAATRRNFTAGMFDSEAEADEAAKTAGEAAAEEFASTVTPSPTFPQSPDPYDPTKHAPQPANDPAPPAIPPAPAPAADPPPQPVQQPGAAQHLRYQQRIRVIEAYRFDGNVRQAPHWVNRNWIAVADYQEGRDSRQGPALRVPSGDPDNPFIVRIGDYLVKQAMSLAPGVEEDEVIAAWAAADFERQFMPVRGLLPLADPLEDV